MGINVIKRSGKIVPFDRDRIISAIVNAMHDTDKGVDIFLAESIATKIENAVKADVSVEDIQDKVERMLMASARKDVAKSYIIYRKKRSDNRFRKERIAFMDKYSQSSQNAASASETDDNANVSSKNVASLESEVYKVENREIHRITMKDKLQELFPDVALQYKKDLEHHIIYTNDEASTPVKKPYCMAASLYPLLLEGTGNIDGCTPSEPNDLQSFAGQLANLAFLLSSQCKGAVAFGGYFVALNYFVVQEYGEEWYKSLDAVVTSNVAKIQRTVKDMIRKSMKQFIFCVNQPAGNRSFNSPFTNISYFDSAYFTGLFSEFYYPDFTQPTWEQIDTLQRIFLQLHREIRLQIPLTFPVTTMALVHDGNDYLDKAYKELTAEEYSKGQGMFTYISDSVDSLASCCRLKNELSENTFSPTSGLTGIKTGSCNVITLNMSRIIQDWEKDFADNPESIGKEWCVEFQAYLISILERVYKYHIAWKTMLYDMEDLGMYASSNGDYIHLSDLYSTIGINGLNEAAEFMGYSVGNNPEYLAFLKLILSTIKEQNKLHSIHDVKRPFLFNSEVVPAEGLGPKNYNWDKEDGYWVPEDRNLYNSYFYLASDPNTSITDKFILHGHSTYQYTDGGSALHLNLDSHPSKDQVLKMLDFARQEGTQYWTINVPYTQCKVCGHIVHAPLKECPTCKSTRLRYYTRIIGYLRPVDNFSEARRIEESKRFYHPTHNA